MNCRNAAFIVGSGKWRSAFNSNARKKMADMTDIRQATPFPGALSQTEQERQVVVDTLHSDRFIPRIALQCDVVSALIRFYQLFAIFFYPTVG
jgi:hypothetical protein